MYLLQRLKRLKISVMASATRSSSILAVTFLTAAVAVSFSSSSTASRAPVFSTTPPKYLLDMATVRFTRFPSVLARSAFSRSTSSS